MQNRRFIWIYSIECLLGNTHAFTSGQHPLAYLWTPLRFSWVILPVYLRGDTLELHLRTPLSSVFFGDPLGTYCIYCIPCGHPRVYSGTPYTTDYFLRGKKTHRGTVWNISLLQSAATGERRVTWPFLYSIQLSLSFFSFFLSFLSLFPIFYLLSFMYSHSSLSYFFFLSFFL